MRLIFLLFLTLNLLNAKLFSEEKLALLIGNSDYSFAPLKNPTHDVDGIAQTLRDIGFKSSDITVLKNASQSQMQKALANFSQKAQSAEIALIYFSGHGMQVNNTNYMFPARTTAKKTVDLYGLVDLNYFIQSATSAKYGIVLVDACRDNPLVKYFNNGKKGSVQKGLGQVTPTVGQMVIGFATSAGDTADDGSGSMSPYASALSVRLKERDDIRNVLGKVGNDVSKKYEQNPIYRANLSDSVFLNKNLFDNKKIKDFFKKLITLMEEKKVNTFMQYFSDEVLYYGSYTSKENIRNSKQTYLNKWDKLDYEIISINISDTDNNSIKEVNILMNFKVSNNCKVIRGKSTATYKLDINNKKIIYENSKVITKETKIL